jgi:uncharacterized protein (TIGR03118 family)
LAPSLDIKHLAVAFDSSGTGAVYTGLAMTPQGVESVLLAVDFRNGVVDTFSGDFIRQAGVGRFVEPGVACGLCTIWHRHPGRTRLRHVCAARRNGPRAAGRRGPRSCERLQCHGPTGAAGLVPAGSALNAPWNVALAPADFGAFGGALLVANAGDGTIAAFDPASGRPLGRFTKPDGAALVIDGLHRIAFGNGGLGQPTDALFFTAGPQGGIHGRFGRIDLL